MEFGARLAKARKNKGLSMEALGEGLGTDGKDVTKQTVWGWEDGRHFPKTDQLFEICRRLNCSADYLLFGTEAALSPAAAELGRELDAVADPQEREQAFQLCKGTIRMASSHASRRADPGISDSNTRRAG